MLILPFFLEVKLYIFVHSKCYVRLRPSGMLRSVDWYLVTDVSGQLMVPNSKSQAVHSLYRLTLEDGPDTLFRNVGN